MTEDAGPQSFKLPDALDFTAAAALAEKLSSYAGEDLVIDAGAVQRLGGSCLQVLIAAGRTWKSGGYALTIERPSPRFLEDLGLLGFEPESLLTGAVSS